MRIFDLPPDLGGVGAERLEVTATLFHTRGMKINWPAPLIAPALVLALAVAGCTGSPPQPAPAMRSPAATPPRPQLPSPQPLPAQPAPALPAPALPAPRAAASGWRDLPQTPGSWTYSADSSGSVARFGQPGAGALVALRCDRGRAAVVLQRAGFGSSDVPATITTTSTARRLTAVPAGGAAAVRNAPIAFEMAFAARDPLLDAIAFSRGRFMLEMRGSQTLILPAWSEVGRVIEDCR